MYTVRVLQRKPCNSGDRYLSSTQTSAKNNNEIREVEKRIARRRYYDIAV